MSERKWPRIYVPVLVGPPQFVDDTDPSVTIKSRSRYIRERTTVEALVLCYALECGHFMRVDLARKGRQGKVHCMECEEAAWDEGV